MLFVSRRVPKAIASISTSTCRERVQQRKSPSFFCDGFFSNVQNLIAMQRKVHSGRSGSARPPAHITSTCTTAHSPACLSTITTSKGLVVSTSSRTFFNYQKPSSQNAVLTAEKYKLHDENQTTYTGALWFSIHSHWSTIAGELKKGYKCGTFSLHFWKRLDGIEAGGSHCGEEGARRRNSFGLHAFGSLTWFDCVRDGTYLE